MLNNNYYLNHFFLFVIIILSILITNNDLDLENLMSSGFTDGYTFIKILIASPDFTLWEITGDSGISTIWDISLAHAQRFFIYYFFGFIYDFINIDLKIFLHITVIFLLFLNFLNLNIIFKHLKIDYNFQFILILVFFFNPYISRYFIHAPFMIADLIFFTSFNFLILFIIIKKFYGIVLVCFFCAITRQTSLMLLFPLLLFYNDNFIKNNFKKFFLIPIFFIIIIFSNIYLSKISMQLYVINEEYKILGNQYLYYFDFLLGFFYFLLSDLPIIIKLKLTSFFVGKFIIAHMFIIIMLIFSIYRYNLINRKLNLNFTHFLIICFVLSVWLQPILAGPISSPINRLTILSHGGLFILFFYIFNYKISLNASEKLYFFSIFLISSFHHEYSILHLFYNRNVWLVLLIICGTLFLQYFNKKTLKFQYE